MPSQQEELITVLRYLRDNGPICGGLKYLDLSPLAETQGWSHTHTWEILHILQNSGWVEIDPELGKEEIGACLTVRGLAIVDPNNPLAPKNSGGVTVSGDFYGAGIVSGQATVNIHIDAANFLEDLRRAIENEPKIPEKNRRSLLSALRQLTQNPLLLKITQHLLDNWCK